MDRPPPLRATCSQPQEKYAALLQKLNASCRTSCVVPCGIISPSSPAKRASRAAHADPKAHHATSSICGTHDRHATPSSPLPSSPQSSLLFLSSSSPDASLLLSGAAVTTSSAAGACSSSSSFASYAPQFYGDALRPAHGAALDDYGSVDGSPLFEVRVHRRRRRNNIHSDHPQRCALPSPPPPPPPSLSSQSPHRVSSQTSPSHVGVPVSTPLYNAALSASARRGSTMPTAGDYYCHFLTEYRRRCSSLTPSTPLQAMPQATGEKENDALGAPGGSTRGGHAHRLQALQQRDSHPPCLPTPGCSPIVAVRGEAAQPRSPIVIDSPDVACCLFTSASSSAQDCFATT